LLLQEGANRMASTSSIIFSSSTGLVSNFRDALRFWMASLTSV
jgi:hypothetical protein